MKDAIKVRTIDMLPGDLFVSCNHSIPRPFVIISIGDIDCGFVEVIGLCDTELVEYELSADYTRSVIRKSS